jgi:hypothetical protein
MMLCTRHHHARMPANSWTFFAPSDFRPFFRGFGACFWRSCENISSENAIFWLFSPIPIFGNWLIIGTFGSGLSSRPYSFESNDSPNPCLRRGYDGGRFSRSHRGSRWKLSHFGPPALR